MPASSSGLLALKISTEVDRFYRMVSAVNGVMGPGKTTWIR